MVSDRSQKLGRPSHEPTESTRRLVLNMRAQDRPISAISVALGLSEPTVRLHYVAELLAARPQLIFPFPDIPIHLVPRRPRMQSGRPAHQPSDQTRERVEILIAGGMAQWQIAAALDLSEPTLREHYALELGCGKAKRTAQVVEALFRSATDGGNVSAQKAWLAMPRTLDTPPTEGVAQSDEHFPLGKKEAAQRAALSITEGSGWDGLLPN
jgi:DNA-binding CsgD family transcriptional regulator